MSKEVWKFATDLSKLDDVITLEIPRGAKVLSAVNQYESLCIYAAVSSQQKPIPHEFRVAGTGHPLDLSVNAKFLDTVLFQEGRLVFHVWDLGEKP